MSEDDGDPSITIRYNTRLRAFNLTTENVSGENIAAWYEDLLGGLVIGSAHRLNMTIEDLLRRLGARTRSMKSEIEAQGWRIGPSKREA